MPTVLACLWRRVAATQLGRVPTHFGPATRLRRPESPWNQGALATSQVEMCPRTANSGQAKACCPFHDDERPSCSVNLERRIFHCHAGSCGVSGNVLEFVHRMETKDGEIRSEERRVGKECR